MEGHQAWEAEQKSNLQKEICSLWCETFELKLPKHRAFKNPAGPQALDCGETKIVSTPKLPALQDYNGPYVLIQQLFLCSFLCVVQTLRCVALYVQEDQRFVVTRSISHVLRQHVF